MLQRPSVNAVFLLRPLERREAPSQASTTGGPRADAPAGGAAPKGAQAAPQATPHGPARRPTSQASARENPAHVSSERPSWSWALERWTGDVRHYAQTSEPREADRYHQSEQPRTRADPCGCAHRRCRHRGRRRPCHHRGPARKRLKRRPKRRRSDAQRHRVELHTGHQQWTELNHDDQSLGSGDTKTHGVLGYHWSHALHSGLEPSMEEPHNWRTAVWTTTPLRIRPHAVIRSTHDVT